MPPDIIIEYPDPKPIILTTVHEDCEPSMMNGRWKVLDGDVIDRLPDKTTRTIWLRLRRVEE
jgi:hypothetical protein